MPEAKETILNAFGDDVELALDELFRRLDDGDSQWDFTLDILGLLDDGTLTKTFRVTTPTEVHEYFELMEVPEVYPDGYNTLMDDVEYIISKSVKVLH